jgi:uncharacterized RDD family membrane protein YckC
MYYRTRKEFHHKDELILATVKKRFIAFIVDWIVLIAIYFSIIILFGLFNMNISKINVHSIFDVEIEMKNVNALFITFFKFILGLLPILYFTIAFYFFNGQTIGKYLFRIKVLSLYHEHLRLWHCIERSLGYLASALEFGFGYIQAFWNPNRMTLHDKIGETIVVNLPVKKSSNTTTAKQARNRNNDNTILFL